MEKKHGKKTKTKKQRGNEGVSRKKTTKVGTKQRGG